MDIAFDFPNIKENFRITYVGTYQKNRKRFDIYLFTFSIHVKHSTAQAYLIYHIYSLFIPISQDVVPSAC